MPPLITFTMCERHSFVCLQVDFERCVGHHACYESLLAQVRSPQADVACMRTYYYAFRFGGLR